MRRTPLIATINKEDRARVRRDWRAVSFDKCFRATVYMHALLSVGSIWGRVPSATPSPLPPPRDRKTQGTRRRNFSIRFPSAALINCGQFLKRRNEGTAAMHSSRAFLIGSRARRIFVHRWRDVWFFYARRVFCANSRTLAKRGLVFNNLHGSIICTIASNIRELYFFAKIKSTNL